MRVTVIVPCRNEERHLPTCLDSILATTFPRDALEVLVVDGESDDQSRAIADAVARRDARVRVLRNPRRIVATALNLGIQEATGDIIVRMDAHGVYPPEYLPRLVRALDETGADNVGGRIVTLPADDGIIPRAIATAMSHPLGVGNSHFRIGTRERRWTDTVPFGCFRRDVFARFGLFDEELVRNQDDELNHRIIRRGGRILLVPEVAAEYYARRSFGQLARMYYQYGSFKPLVAKKVGRVMTLRQLAPPGLVAGLAGLGLAGIGNPVAAQLGAVLAVLYLGIVMLAAALVGRRQGLRFVLALALAFTVLHVSYGIGFLRGVPRLWAPGRRRLDPATLPLSR